MAASKEQGDEDFGLRMLLENLEDQARTTAAFQQLHMLLVELGGLSSDSAAVEQIVGARGCEIEERLARMGESRARVRREQKLRKERAAQRTVDVQELIDQMQRAHEVAVATNERYRRILKFIVAACHLSQDYEFKEITTLSPSYCELPLSRGTPGPEPVSDSRILNVNETSPRRLSINDRVAEHRPDPSPPERLNITEHRPGSSSPKRLSIKECVAEDHPVSFSPKPWSINDTVVDHRPDSSSLQRLSINQCVGEDGPDSSSSKSWSLNEHHTGSSSPKRWSINDSCVEEHSPDSSSLRRLSINENRPGSSSSAKRWSINDTAVEDRPDSSSLKRLSINEYVAEDRPDSSSPKQLSINDSCVAEHRPRSSSPKRWLIDDSCFEEHRPDSSSSKRSSMNDSVAEHCSVSSSAKRWTINEHRPGSSSPKRLSIKECVAEDHPISFSPKPWSINDTVADHRPDSSSLQRLSINQCVGEDGPDTSSSKPWSLNEHHTGSSSPKRWSINDSCVEEHSPDSSSLRRLSINENRPDSSSSAKRWSINEHRPNSSSSKRWNINDTVVEDRPDSSSLKRLSINEYVAEDHPDSSSPKRLSINEYVAEDRPDSSSPKQLSINDSCVAEHRPGSSSPKRWLIDDSCFEEHRPDSSSSKRSSMNGSVAEHCSVSSSAKRWTINEYRPGSSAPKSWFTDDSCDAEHRPDSSSSKRLGIPAHRPGSSSPTFCSGVLSCSASECPKLDSSSDSSSACSSVDATPRFGSRALSRKPPPFVPRLDLSASSELHKTPSPAPFETPSRRSTSSARLISLTDADDSARMMLSRRIKRKAKISDGKPAEEAIEARISPCEPSIPEVVELAAIMQGTHSSTEITRKDETHPPEHELRRSVSPPALKSTEMPLPCDVDESVPTKVEESLDGSLADLEASRQERRIQMLLWPTEEKLSTQSPPDHKIRRSLSPPAMKSTEMPLPCDVAESVPTKVEESADGGLADLQAARLERRMQSSPTEVEERGFAELQASNHERRIQMLLWPTREKLSMLRILTNTMFLWEDKPAPPSAISDDLVLSTLAATRESQRRLFDALDTVRGVPRRAVCCRAVRELVRAYPPERLVPTSFINNNHFRMSAASLRSMQDSEAAEFWHALVHHVVSLADHRMASVEESAKEFAEVLLHEMREADVVGDAHLARFELQSFLTRCFRTEPVAECPPLPPQDEEQDSSEELLPVSDTARTYASSAPSQIEEVGFGKQVRDITVTHGRKAVVAVKHSRKSSLSIFSSLKFWKRKPQKVPPMDIDYFSMLNVHHSMDGSERPRRGHTSSKDYGFSLKI